MSAGVGSLAGLAAACRRQRPPAQGLRALAFVANYDGKAIAVADLSAFAVTRHIALDDQPTEVIAPRGAPHVFALTPASGVIHSINPQSLKLDGRISLGQPVKSMRLSRDRRSVFALAGRKLMVVDVEKRAVAGSVSLPEPGVDLDATSENLDAVAVSGGSTGQVWLIDPAARTILASAKVESELQSVRFLSNSSALIVADLKQRSLSVFETKGLKRVVELPLSLRPDRLCFSQDGGQLFVTGTDSNALAVVYPYYTPQVAETVLAGRSPGAMAASPDPGAYLFIANRGSNDVSILNVRTRRVIATVGVGAEPDFVTVTPEGLHALVLNRKSGDMAVLRIGGITRNRQKMAGLFTMIPVGSSPVSAAVRMV